MSATIEREIHMEKRGVGMGFVNGVLLSIVSGSLGFGMSQLTIGGDVRTHTIEITQIQKQSDVDRESTTSQINKLIEAMTAQTKATSEVVMLIKVQQQLDGKAIR